VKAVVEATRAEVVSLENAIEVDSDNGAVK